MTKVFLVVVSVWGMAYRGDQATPAFVQQMPDFASCWAVGKALTQMTLPENSSGGARFRCVKVTVR